MDEALTSRRAGRLRALVSVVILIAAGLLAITAIQPGRADAKRAQPAAVSRGHVAAATAAAKRADLVAKTRAHISTATLVSSVLVVGDVSAEVDNIVPFRAGHVVPIQPRDGLALKLSTLFSENGYQATMSTTLPSDLSQYGSVWYVSATPPTVAQQSELESYVRMGRGLYLQDGEYASNASDGYEASVVNALTGEKVTVSALNISPEYPLSNAQFNLNAPDGVGSVAGKVDCYADSECDDLAALFDDSFTGVPAANVLATVVQTKLIDPSITKTDHESVVRAVRGSSLTDAANALLDPSGTYVTAAAYDHSSIVGGLGALLAAGGQGWYDLSSLEPQTEAAAVNFQRFLSSQVAPTATNGATYVALGDSYSSGEGDIPFADQGGPDGCDRSLSKAYPDIIARDLHLAKNGKAFDFEACSGATIGDLWPKSLDPRGHPNFGNYYEMTGLTTGEAGLGPNTKLVTLTIGGNDIGFSDIAQTCSSLPPLYKGTKAIICPKDEEKKDAWVRDVKQHIRAMRAKLVALYEGIKLLAPNAVGHIYVLGYPDLFRPTRKEDSGFDCNLATFQQAQTLVWMYKIQQQLNAVIESAAKQAKIKYVDPNKPGPWYSFQDHAYCGKATTWFNAVLHANLPGNDAAGAYHPNDYGQAALAAALVAAGATKTKVR